jgi:hypothetical protein
MTLFGINQIIGMATYRIFGLDSASAFKSIGYYKVLTSVPSASFNEQSVNKGTVIGSFMSFRGIILNFKVKIDSINWDRVLIIKFSFLTFLA